MSQNRVGLVLSGGGINGVYSLGVIKALTDNGIAFHAVSGTSVGAIVASVLSTDSTELAYDTFTTPRFLTPCLMMPLVLFLFPYGLLRAFDLGGKAWLMTLVTSLLGYPHEIARRRVSLALHLANLFTPLALIILSALLWIAGASVMSWGVPPCLALFWATINVKVIEAEMREDTLALSLLGDRSVPFAANTGLAAFTPAWVLSLRHYPEHLFLAAAISGSFGIIMCFVVARLIDWLAAFDISKVEAFLLDNVLVRRFTIPTFVCCSYSLEVYDPDNITWRLADPRASVWTHLGLPVVRTMPSFTDISQLPVHIARAFISASAAVPAGVLPTVRAGGRQLSDGCMIANSPAYPLLASEKCSHLIHINIGRSEVSKVDLEIQYQQIDRLLRLQPHTKQPSIRTRPYQHAGESRHNDPPIHLPYTSALPEFELFTIKADNEILLDPLTANKASMVALRDAGYQTGLELTSSIKQFLRLEQS